jgi:hypothetical protein
MSDEVFKLRCPRCRIQIEVLAKNMRCRVFRCGVYKKSLRPINPHSSLKACTKMLNDDLIYGCTQPFKILQNMEVIICDYTE